MHAALSPAIWTNLSIPGVIQRSLAFSLIDHTGSVGRFTSEWWSNRIETCDSSSRLACSFVSAQAGSPLRRPNRLARMHPARAPDFARISCPLRARGLRRRFQRGRQTGPGGFWLHQHGRRGGRAAGGLHLPPVNQIPGRSSHRPIRCGGTSGCHTSGRSEAASRVSGILHDNRGAKWYKIFVLFDRTR